MTWKTRFKTQVSSGSDFPSDAMLWIKEVETFDSLDELKFSRSVYGKDFPDFEMPDAKIASALNKIIQNSQFKNEEQKAQKDYRFLRGRSDWRSWHTLDCADFFSVTQRDDNVKEFDTRFDEVLLSMTKIWSDEILESLYNLRIRESDQLKSILELYDLDIHQKKSNPDYQKLKTMVERRIDQKLRLRKHGKIESGVMGKSRKGATGVEGGKGTCYQWKEKGQCSQGDRCSFRHATQDRAQKPEHTAATLSEPTASWARSVSEKRSIRCKSNHGSMARQPCRYYSMVPSRELFVNIGIHPSANSIQQKRVVRREGDMCVFLHYKIDEQPNKKPKKGYFHQKEEKVKTKALWLFVKSVSQLGCVSQDSDALASQGTKEFRGNPMQKVLNAIQRVRFTKSTLRHASIRDKKGPSLGKIQVKPQHQRSPYAPKFEDRSHEKTGRLQRCAKGKAWNLAENMYKLKENDRLQSSHLQRSGFSQVPHQESRVRESL